MGLSCLGVNNNDKKYSHFWVSIWLFDVKEGDFKKGQVVRGLSVINCAFHLGS